MWQILFLESLILDEILKKIGHTKYSRYKRECQV
jgi:hypothetical protein